ncbi:MAG: metalloregulator ArsR/SmtB family transcription factor [Pseudomonadota bacterium]
MFRMTASPDILTEALRAAGEPTRFRILALLRRGELAVGELVQVLEQSQPRLSHHLKTLAMAGLVDRLPEGSWVFYRAAREGWAARLLDGLFDEAICDTTTLSADVAKLEHVRENRAKSAASYFGEIAEDWDRLRSMHFPNEALEGALLDLAGRGPYGRVIDLGTGTGRMLTLFAPFAQELEGLDLSHQMLTVARANLDAAGVEHASVRQGDVSETPFPEAHADLVIVHQVLHYLDAPDRVIAEAARILRPGGQLLVVDFAPHTLDFLRQDFGHRRLGIRSEDMQRWTEAANLEAATPLAFDPPETLEHGLHVNIWSAKRPQELQSQGVAA